MEKIFQYIKSNQLALLSGVLIGTSFIPFPPWALLFCYVPLWIFSFSSQRSLKEVFLAGWITQFILTIIGFHWISETAHEFGQIPWPIAILALLLFASFMHLYIPASLMLARWLKDRFKLSLAASLVTAALCLSIFERTWPAIFQWHLGYAWFAAKIPIYQLADIIGFEGLSTITLLFNAWIAWIWLNQSEVKKARIHCGALIIVFASLCFGGHLNKISLPKPDREITASIIQANIGNLEKIYAEKGQGYQESIINKFISLSKAELIKNPETELLVWPETAFPDYLGNDFLGRKHTNILTQGLAEIQKNLITGAYFKQPEQENKDSLLYNAIFLLKASGETWSEPYRKTHLLAFGEYLPFSERFPFLLKLFPFVSNFGRGNGPTTLNLSMKSEPLLFGPQICYESLYPKFSRGLAEKKAQILVNITNDSWFGKNFEPFQHMYMTLARAIEVRRPMIRSTNTGVSTVVLADGKILERSPLAKEWAGTYKIPYSTNTELSFFVRWGHYDWILWLTIIAFIILKGFKNAKSRDA
jgi:apolipoprotein N-acyltransferase